MNELRPTLEELKFPRIGEVVDSSSDKFLSQCYELYKAPHLGSVVRTASGQANEERGGGAIYAVVCGVTTQSLDRGRIVVARGAEETSEEDVYRNNPQIGRLLCTRFQSLIVGEKGNEGIYHRLPSLPPRIHAFVYSCDGEEVRSFTNSLNFLGTLVNATAISSSIADEVIAACIREASAHHDDPKEFLVRAGKSLALQLIGDPFRLNAMLKRLSV